MAKPSTLTPIEGDRRVRLTEYTRRFSDVLEDCCEDLILRAKVYSESDGSIWMRAIGSDEDGTSLVIMFRINPDGSELTISNNFATVGGKSQRRNVFNRLQKSLVEYIENLNKVSSKIASVVFDLGARFNRVSYDMDPDEKGCIRVYLLAYKKEYCDMSEMAGSKNSDLVNIG